MVAQVAKGPLPPVVSLGQPTMCLCLSDTRCFQNFRKNFLRNY